MSPPCHYPSELSFLKRFFLLVNYKSLVIKRLRWKLWRWKMSNNQSRPAGKHRTPEVFTSMLDVSRQAGIRCSVSVAFFKPLGTSSSFNPRFSLARRSAAKTARIRGAFLFIRVHSRAFAVLFFFFGCGYAALGRSVSPPCISVSPLPPGRPGLL